MAARLYVTGVVKTKKAAAEAVGLHPAWFTRMTILNPATRKLIGDMDSTIQDESIALSKIIAMLSRRAAGRLSQLMDSDNEHIALKASSDILDRNPETSKSIKATVTSFSLSGEDAKAIAASLVESAKVRDQYKELAQGDFVKVNMEAPSNGQEEDAGDEGQNLQRDHEQSEAPGEREEAR
jgi:hypothetical protein